MRRWVRILDLCRGYYPSLCRELLDNGQIVATLRSHALSVCAQGLPLFARAGGRLLITYRSTFLLYQLAMSWVLALSLELCVSCSPLHFYYVIMCYYYCVIVDSLIILLYIFYFIFVHYHTGTIILVMTLFFMVWIPLTFFPKIV